MTRTETQGLTDAEAARRLREVGPNRLEAKRGSPALRILKGQLDSPLIWLLLAGAVLSGVLGEHVDAAAIGTIVALVVAVGAFQEFRAEAALEALTRLGAPRARVRRSGRLLDLPAADVVPGDLLRLEAGDVVAADADVVQAAHLRLDEAVLTGESAPVAKEPGDLPEGTPMAERRDRVFSGTAVAAGVGEAVVHATGMATEMGRIAGLLGEQEIHRTPLQVQLAQVGRTLMFLSLGVVAITAVAGWLRGIPAVEVLMIAIALAVAAVPEGLPAMVTVALALGVRRMAERNVLVRRLSAVETLGSTTVICTDKTGTLTEGRMAVREVVGDRLDVLRTMAACSDADLGSHIGDTTELAILEAAAEAGIDRQALEAELPRVEEEPFDSATRRMWIRRSDGLIYLKGAPKAVLASCASPDPGARAAVHALGERGLRVLGCARGTELGQLEWVGLVGLADPPRIEVAPALADARRAGIRTVMITGDHRDTARAIARELGLVQPGDDVDELVRARATATDKLELVRQLKAGGAVVAMTGDGVNDAPAVREADIGVAMGRAGTEVTRGASDMVLLDDNYASIVAAVREGRGIWDDIQNALVYLLGGNAGELAIIAGSILAGFPPVLLPLQILWINLVSDGLPALALVTEPPASDVLDRPPRAPGRPMLDRGEWLAIVAIGLLDTAVVMSVYGWALSTSTHEVARTMAFTALVSCELLRAFAARSSRLTAVELGLFGNPALWVAVFGPLLLQIVMVSWEPAREVFHLAPLAPGQLAFCLSVGLVPATLLELRKLGARALQRG